MDVKKEVIKLILTKDFDNLFRVLVGFFPPIDIPMDRAVAEEIEEKLELLYNLLGERGILTADYKLKIVNRHLKKIVKFLGQQSKSLTKFYRSLAYSEPDPSSKRKFVSYFYHRIIKNERVEDPFVSQNGLSALEDKILLLLSKYELNRTIDKDTINKYLRPSSVFNLKGKGSMTQKAYLNNIRSICEDLDIHLDFNILLQKIS